MQTYFNFAGNCLYLNDNIIDTGNYCQRHIKKWELIVLVTASFVSVSLNERIQLYFILFLYSLLPA